MSFAKNMGKNLSNKYGQKLLDIAKKSTTNATKASSKREIQKTAEATDNLIGNKIADKITSVSKRSSARSKNLENDNTNHELEATEKRYISPEGRQQVIDELSLVKQYNNRISKNSKFVRQRSCSQHIKSTI